MEPSSRSKTTTSAFVKLKVFSNIFIFSLLHASCCLTLHNVDPRIARLVCKLI
jgi:hypothetical protein